VGTDLEGFPHITNDVWVEGFASGGEEWLGGGGQHRGARSTDLLIAALAQVYGMTLLHYDRHFDSIARATGMKAEWVAPRGTLE